MESETEKSSPEETLEEKSEDQADSSSLAAAAVEAAKPEVTGAPAGQVLLEAETVTEAQVPVAVAGAGVMEQEEVEEPVQVQVQEEEKDEEEEEKEEKEQTAEGKVEEADKVAQDEDTELTPEQKALPWYVVHTYSGFEMFAKKTLEERLKAHGLLHRFGQVLVPQETVEELVRGEKKTSKRKFFPGYILIQVDLDDETWHIVKDTPKVTGFVGDSRHPSPLTEKEVTDLLKQMESGAARPRPRVNFEEGDAVKVVDGPFTDFNGTVDDVKPDKGKLRVLISIFGRNTPVELDFVQVEKA